MAENTFLGLQPYTEDDAYRFKGRAEESQELFRLVVRNDFTVCYAESGEGKTSLLNAGVFPLLRENMYFPIAITFTSDDYQVTPDNFSTIIDRCIKDSITEYNEKNKGINVEYRLCSTDFQDLDSQAELQQELSRFSWWKLRNYKPQAMGLTFTPVFVFDQFEEVFNMPGSIVWTKKFFDWLEDVSSDSCPDEIAKKIRTIIGINAAFPSIKEEKDFKAVFSLRKEFIGELDYWGMQKCFIPSLKDNRYCLKALTYEGAKKVMTQQERFDEGKVEQILTHFVGQYSREPEKTIKEQLPIIPALLLSVVCDSWEKDISSFAKLSTDEISQSLNKILEKFYYDTIDAVIKELSSQNASLSDSDSIRKDIDVAMFDLVDVNGKRVRVKAVTTLSTISMESKKRFSETLPIIKYKEILYRHRIVKITKIDGEDYVEIVHDCLCTIIAKRRELRLAEEAKEREEQALQEQSQKNRKRLSLLLFIILALFIISGFFYYQNIKIQEQRNIAEKANKELEENQRSLKEAKDSILHVNSMLLGKQGELQNAIIQLQMTKDSLVSSNLLALLNERKAISNLIHAENSESEAVLIYVNNLISNGQLIDAATNLERIVDNLESKYNPSIRSRAFVSLRNLYFAYNNGGQYDKLIAHNGQICDMCFNSDGSMIATSSNDQTIRIWSTKTGQLIKEYPLDASVGDVWSSRSVDDFFRTFNSANNTYKQYKTYSSLTLDASVRVRREGIIPSFYSSNTVMSPDGMWALSERDNCVFIYKGKDVLQQIQLEEGTNIGYMEFAYDNSRFLICIDNQKEHFSDGCHVKEYSVEGKLLKTFDFSPNLITSHFGCVYLPYTYDILYLEHQPVIMRENGSVETFLGDENTNKLAISFSSNIIALGSKDGSLVLYNYEQKHPYRNGRLADSLFFVKEMRKYDSGMEIHDGHIRDSYRGISLKSLGDKAYIVDGKRNTEIALVGHQNNIGNVIFNRTHDMVITRAFDNTIRFWSVKTGKEIDSLRIRVGGYGNQSIFCSRNNKYLVSSSDDMLYVWEILSGEIVFSMPYKDVQYSCFSKDGNKILFTSGFGNKEKDIKVVNFLSDDELIDWFKNKMPKRKNER